MKCPLCEAEATSVTLIRKNPLPEECSVCNLCGGEFWSIEQWKKNEQAPKQFLKDHVCFCTIGDKQ